jgi:hypothetical protein
MSFVLVTYFRHFRLYKYAFTPAPVVQLVLEASAWPSASEELELAEAAAGEAVGVPDGSAVEPPASAGGSGGDISGGEKSTFAAAVEEAEEELDAPTDEAPERLQSPEATYRASLVEALAPMARAIKLSMEDKILFDPEETP